MKKIEKFTSIAMPIDMDNIDTDMIIPAKFLTTINKQGLGENLFSELCKQDKNFCLNNHKYSNSQIIIAKNNFGCGSSREHAVWALQQAEFSVIICESFSDIFYNNAAKNGLLLIKMSKNIIAKLLKDAKNNKLFITIDLENQQITAAINNNYNTYNFEYDAFRKQCLINGQDDMDYLLQATKEVIYE